MSIGAIYEVGSMIYGIVGPPMLRQCGYAVFCKAHASGLKDQISKLQGVAARVQHSVDESRGKGEYIEEDVLKWLNDVDQLIASGSQILEENKLRWFLGFVPDPKACYKLGRKAKKSVPDFEQLCSGGKFDTVSYHRVDEHSIIVGAASSSKRNYVHLKSRNSVLDLVMKALDDDKISVIGVYGMGGVGKSTLLKEVENRARESNKFNGVASVFVSQNPDMTRLRAEIEYRLGRIGRSDESRKTVLILLDDLWKELSLKDIGVPESDTKLKIKLVMTSRNQQLLTNEMNCHPAFPLGSLNEEEGWQFFVELVSSNTKIEDWKRNPKAVELLGKCAGLPVSIEALATILKKKMKGSSSSTDDLLSVDELKLGKESLDGSASIEWSYNYLGDSNEEKQAKLVFRTIGLIGTPNIPILTLLKYTIGLGLFGSGIDHTIMERARREITRSLRTLQDSSLLLESDDSNHVKIHDVVRDVAVRIASRDDHALIFDPIDGVKGWSEEKLEKCTSLSLPYSAIPELQKEWKCPNINTFIMDAQQGECFDLPNSIFKGMVKLTVIHLTHARLVSFPSTQHDLQTLTTLFLHYCCLENVAAIGQLESLQVLSFIGSDIVNLPIEIGALTKLRMLDLSKCPNLESIEPGVLQNLRRLEELYLRESFDRWEAQGDAEKTNACLDELNNLPHLSTLEVRVADTRTLPLDLPLGNLVQYKVLMGDVWELSREYKESRYLKMKMNVDDILAEGLIFNEKWLQLTLQKTQDLHLDGLEGAWDTFHEVCNHGFEELKHLHLQNSSSIKWIIWSTEWLECNAFTILESMHLEKLKNLEMICHGLISSTSFQKLKVVKVQECDKLTNLFNLSLLRSLTDLEEIEISNCKMIEQIVFAERLDIGGNDEIHHTIDVGSSNNLYGCIQKRSKVSKEVVAMINHEIQLKNLRCLKLRSLPEITAFLSSEGPSVSVDGQTIPAFFNDQEVSLPRIKDIQASAQLGLGNLRQVELLDCNKIVHFINSRMLPKLQNLESLTIARCDALEDIFDLEGIDAKSGIVEILPKLNELKLRGLPRLEHIWKKKNSNQIKGCQKLRTLEIHQCDNLVYLCCSTMCQGMQSLTEINVVLCNKMEKLFMEEEGLPDGSGSVMLPSLKILGVLECPNLKEFLSGNSQTTSSSAAPVDSSLALSSSNQAMSRWCLGTQEPIQEEIFIQEDTSITFFNRKVSLPNLENLVLFGVASEKLWCSEVPDQSYCNLEFVHLNGCDNLSTVFPATLIERLQQLKQLVISHCNLMKSVFDLDFGWKNGEKPKAFMLSQLQQVKLLGLHALTRIIMQRGSDDEIVVGFPSLKHLEVSSCSKLIDLIITTATATTLLKLETLYIFGSRDLQEVIHGEMRDKNKRSFFSFPHLTSLTIFSLYKLSHFSSMSYLLDLKCLKVLHISTCGSFKTMVNPRPEVRQGSLDHGDAAHTDTESLFNDKVELPNLEELHVNEIKVEALWCNEPRRGSFCKLKILYVNLCSELQYIIPSVMIKRLQNLEHLTIKLCYSLQDIFKDTSTQPIQPGVLERHIADVEKDIVGKIPEETGRRTIRLTKLTCLELEKIHLSNVWLGSYTLELPSLKKLTGTGTRGATQAIIQKVNLPKLEELEIAEETIEELWHSEPSAESFYRLKQFKVESCHELVKIFPSFMLKRLQNLEKLVVKDCKSLNTIFELKDVVGENSESSNFLLSSFSAQQVHEYGETGDDSTDNRIIALPRLTNLTLEGLRNLIHLFGQEQGNYTLELLSLKEFFLIGSGDKEATTQKVVFPNEFQVKRYNFFGSTTTVLKDFKKALQNKNQVIGLFGVMDPFLFSALTKLLEEEPKFFDKYCWLRNPDSAYEIQETIGEELMSIIYSEPGEQGRAQCLRKSLLSNQDKRLLLILHNVSEEFDFDLEDVGIPYKQLDPKLFKIILISEIRECMEKMGAQEIINIGRKIGDRWEIFESPNKRKSEELAHECGSDDLAEILSEKLQMRDSATREDALQRLRESPYEYEARKRVIESLSWPDLSLEEQIRNMMSISVGDGDDDEDEDEEYN